QVAEIHEAAVLEDRADLFVETADDVAADTVKAWKAGKEVVYSPKVLRAVMGTMKVLPRPIFRIVSAR
ncbi:MAG: hypothetical protein ACH36H_10230, partial [Candidatus Nanopelagicales bacterium]